MNKNNKELSLDNFIKLLRTKIIIILLCTCSLSAIIGYFQLEYRDYWKVNFFKKVDNSALISTMFIIQEKNDRLANLLSGKADRINSVDFMTKTNNLISNIMINYLDNKNIEYDNLRINNNNFIKKEKIQLIINNKNFNKIKLEENLIKYFSEINILTKKMLILEHGIDENYNLEIFNFEIIDQKRVIGYDYVKLLKIIIINLMIVIFFTVSYSLRKKLKLL